MKEVYIKASDGATICYTHNGNTITSICALDCLKRLTPLKDSDKREAWQHFEKTKTKETP